MNLFIFFFFPLIHAPWDMRQRQACQFSLCYKKTTPNASVCFFLVLSDSCGKCLSSSSSNFKTQNHKAQKSHNNHKSHSINPPKSKHRSSIQSIHSNFDWNESTTSKNTFLLSSLSIVLGLFIRLTFAKRRQLRRYINDKSTSFQWNLVRKWLKMEFFHLGIAIFDFFSVQALMGIKASLLDPHDVLENWDADAVDPCSWTMITCSSESLVIGL